MDRQSARQNAKDAKRREWDEPEPELDLLVHRVIGAPVRLAQVLSYLKAAKLVLGLLITFNVRNMRAGIQRVIHRP